MPPKLSDSSLTRPSKEILGSLEVDSDVALQIATLLGNESKLRCRLHNSNGRLGKQGVAKKDGRDLPAFIKL